MDISVVSGTYNRLALLQSMIESVRRSVFGLYGLNYEIVIVDGGSIDGSIKWCREQPDIVLIEHGQLKGAVKAFNDGAKAATGNYVILANDDIEFIGDSIWRAFVYMQQRSDVGMGCFYQDRNGQDWHVEVMPVVIDNEQRTAVYGQVCIIPRWLGDSRGWWGDYLHTYGGDNELTATIYQAGYRVEAISGCYIHDSSPDDDLRRINNITGGQDPRAVRGHHPDSWAWGQKWRNRSNNLVGPVVVQLPSYPTVITLKQRVVYLPIYEEGWAVQKQQKRGLREALARHAVVAEFDYVGRHAAVGKQSMLNELRELCLKVNPTLLLTQLHNGALINPTDVASLRNVAPLARFINWNGDYWPDNLLTDEGLALARTFDLQTVINREVLEKYQAQGIDAAYWQIGWEPDGVGHEPDGDTRRHDVVFLGNGYSKERKAFVTKLRALNGLDFGLYGQGWPDGWALGQNLYDFRAACRVYRGAKFSLGDSQWPNTGFVSNRVFQALAAGGAALCHQWFRGMDELGLYDGQTVIVWHTFAELIEKINYYLNHEGERVRIAEAGQQLALDRHSFDVRVNELFEMIGKPTNSWEEGWR